MSKTPSQGRAHDPGENPPERMLRMLTQAFDTTQLGITISDTAGKILYTNRAEAEMHGYTAEELVGQDVRIFAPENLRHPLDVGELRDLGSRRHETRNQRRDGSTFPAELRYDVVTDSVGEPIAVITICEDISERKHAEHIQVELEEQLRQAQKMEAIGQLAGGVAHDFNNLLVVIQGHAELALETLEPSSQAHQDLLQVQRAADQAAALTRQLLAFSRRQVLQPTDLRLDRVLDKVLALLRRVIGENIEIRLDVGADLSPVHADHGQLEQVLLNLCVNARDAMPDGGRITLAVTNRTFDAAFCAHQPWARPGDWVCIRVEDTGHGMDAATLRHCFEPFFTTKRAGKGTGLGLATVHGIVEQHEGLIHVDSVPGKGTTFFLCLPALEHVAEESPSEDDPQARGGSETILIAEDDDLVRDLAQRVLQRAGYTVLTAENGRRAVELFRDHHARIDLVLMDMVMPVLGGAGAREEMKQISPQVCALFSSGYSTELAALKPSRSERIAVIHKPYTPDRLLRKIREVLDVH